MASIIMAFTIKYYIYRVNHWSFLYFLPQGGISVGLQLKAFIESITALQFICFFIAVRWVFDDFILEKYTFIRLPYDWCYKIILLCIKYLRALYLDS